MEREVFPNLLKNNYKVIGVVDESYWLDLGTPNAFVKGSCDLVTGKIETGLIKNHSEKIIEVSAQIDENVLISNGSYVGNNSKIGKNSKIDSSVISSQVKIGMNCVIKSSIIAKNVIIEDNCVIENSVIADSVVLGSESILKNDSRIWPDQKVGKVLLDNQTIPEVANWQN